MRFRSWIRIAWTYHLLFAVAVTWPVQALVNNPRPFILGLPGQMTWAAAWVLGSLLVLWRLDSARSREAGAAARHEDSGESEPSTTYGGDPR